MSEVKRVTSFRGLKEHSDKPMAKQKEVFEKTLSDWKGEYEQIDDITVLGIRI